MTLQLSRWGRRPLLSLLGLAAGTWLPLAPGAAQDAPIVPATPPNLQAAPDAPGALAPASPGASMSAISTNAIAASADNVYVLRGRTLYQLRASDLTEVAHKELPIAGLGSIGGGLTGPAGTGGGRLTAPGVPQTPDSPAAPAAPGAATPPAAEAGPPPADGLWAPMADSVRMTATSRYVYILSADTVYQVRASDLSLVSSKPLPLPGLSGTNGTGLAPLTTPPSLNQGLRPRGRAGRGQQPGATAPTTPAP